MFDVKPWENQNLEVKFFELTRKILTTIKFWVFDQNLAIYTVFDKESESEVKKYKISEPGGKKIRKTNVNLNPLTP